LRTKVIPISRLTKKLKKGRNMINQVNQNELQSILGYNPQISIVFTGLKISFFKGKLITEKVSGSVVNLKNGQRLEYEIASCKFEKTCDNVTIYGDGFFNGMWNEKGRKLASLYFKGIESGSIIYLNGGCRTLTRNKEGIVDLCHPIDVLIWAKNDDTWIVESGWPRDIIEKIASLYIELFMQKK
jgi:hypothetical protein